MKDEKEAANEAENIRVAVRCRPMNEREIREKSASCFTAENGNAVLTNLENPAERHQFCFDHVYGSDTQQVTVFNDIGAPILDRAFGGYNGTIFAYGQTGSGKTFSMNGVRGQDDLEGLIPRMNRAIFERIAREKEESPHKLFLVECSFFEIYNEIIYDLLDSTGNSKKNKGGLEIKEHAVLGIYVKDLQERVVDSRGEVIDLMQQGQNARTVGATQMNAESSRSHSIFVIKIHQKDATDESKNIFAKINLVDLAGSERAASTGAQGDRLKEGANINKSLSALGNVINALVEASRTSKKLFIPYRNSKLTRVLQESLGGNSLCSMLATLSPANINFVETLSTLKYASRAKSIKVNAKKNEASSQISQLNDEIAALKKKLTEQTSATLGLDPKEKEEIVKKYEQQIKEMDRVRLQTWEDKAKQTKQHELERKRLAKEKALADQKIREERTRKWKLLEEKGDVELMLRALRDLDRTPTVDKSSCATLEDKWLAKAQSMKSLEAEAKDHRTMILVFKDSVDKDVDQWSKRLVRQDSTTSAAAKRDDTAATHMIVNQLCSKLQNVFDESKQLVSMEKKLVEDGVEFINEMMSDLIKFKEERKLSKTKVNATSAAADVQRAKEDEQLSEEREKGLSMTLALIQRQRARLVSTIRVEHHKMFQLSKVSGHFLKYMDSFITAFAVTDSDESKASHGKWTSAKASLVKTTEAWEQEWNGLKKLDATVGQVSDSIAVTYVPKGEIAPLGMESRIIGDDCLYTSSKKTDAKYLRMNGTQFWVPDEQDAVPFLVVDLGFPRVVQSLAIRGGNTAGSTPIQVPASSSSPGVIRSLVESNQREAAQSGPVPVTTFKIKPADELQEVLQKYKLDQITGEDESTYEILSHAMSWYDLLKTELLPNKLFARPPIRFLHDVISVVINNTGFAKDLFSATEKDYTQLNSKTERADYLTKILDFVQEWYRTQQLEQGDNTPGVIVAATASNILAGKEPTDTLKFLCYLSIAAMQWCAKNSKPKSDQSTPSSSEQLNPESADPSDADTNGNNQAPSGRVGWVKKIRVSTSLTGKQWHVLGDFDANADETSLGKITFPTGTNAVGRFVQITCIEWHEVPLFQVEIYGQEATESDELSKNMNRIGSRASEVVQQLLGSAVLFSEEARASWEKSKDAERERQEEQIKLVAEITRLKQANTEFEKQIKELQQSKAVLQQNVKSETKKATDEKAKSDKLQSELQQSAASLVDMKKEKEGLATKINEQAQALQTATLQLSEQKKALESLQKSKVDLEDLCSTLRDQLQAKNQDEGHQESKIATVMSELLTLTVQLDEAKRRYETSEQMRVEQDTATQKMNAQLQQQIAQVSEQESRAQANLQDHMAEAARSLEALQAERDELRRRVDESMANDTASKAAADALQTQLRALQEELEVWKRQATEALERGSPTQGVIAASSAIANSTAASERMMLEAHTKELRCMAEIEKMELRLQASEDKQKEAEAKLKEVEVERDALSQRIKELEELEDELQMQLQVVTEERDSARLKEEQLFAENNEKEQEIERIRDGYVWVTDRMNSKEDELAELQEQLEKYQALLQITTPAKKKKCDADTVECLMKLYILATDAADKKPRQKDELMTELTRWVEVAKRSALNLSRSEAKSTPSSEVTSKSPSKDTGAKVTPGNEHTGAKPVNEERPSTQSVQQPPAQSKSTAPSTPASSPQAAAAPVAPLPIKTPRDAVATDTKAEAKTVATTTKPATPRHDTPPSKAKLPDASGTKTETDQNEDAYDDDFDADDVDAEAKRQIRRKASEQAAAPAAPPSS